ncbi:bifunctional adenosylcobinamide kinase/adenosylcobinamide-phosphate guanylyltransferase [Brevundimonas sp.]|jgi:adenosylcobinamide kinase/adenosylcobinamide-phosphate guanylyltransferase|uniref:bifunctional adenosylcobinamide kinase/adenosylcobinamide-phosphate guanylyltransferase n=1 Tax=Brevundimonas sp. TaxID=1871086 RepID=UPI0037BE2216
MATLVLGGARSGKTAHALARAEALAAKGDLRLVMIATAQAFDDEMRDRIAHHRAERHPGWTTVEAPHDLIQAIGALEPGDVAVVDCLTLWLSNAMAADLDIAAETQALCAAVVACPARLFLVSNEVGWGIVPDNRLAREFRDHAGRLHQRLAGLVAEVVLVVAGLSLPLKSAAGVEPGDD